LAYYVEWHLKQCLAPLLFEDEEIDDGSLNVIKANRSESAQSKERKKRNQENLPVHSFRTLLQGNRMLIEFSNSEELGLKFDGQLRL